MILTGSQYLRYEISGEFKKLERPDVMNCYVVSPFLCNTSPGLRQWNIRHEQFSAVTWVSVIHRNCAFVIPVQLAN
jgi:hypothetical protein